MAQRMKYYWRTSDSPPPRTICVHTLGIRQPMPAEVIRHGGPGAPYLFVHFHDEAFLYLEGQQPRPAAQGTILWGRSACHAYGNEQQRWLHSWVNVSGALVDELVASYRIPLNDLLFVGGEAVFVKYLGLLYDELHSYVEPDTEVLEGLVRVWMRETARLLGARGMGRILPEPLKEVRALVDANLERRLTLAELARCACLSPSRFSAVFREHFGLAPMRYVQRLRMKRAEALLLQTTATVSQIAGRCGYDDPFQFSKQFHLHAGVSPRQYRKRGKQADT